MSNTFYDSTIPVLQHILATLSHILTKASEHPNANDLLKARLIEDMYPLSDQIRLATQFSENLLARLTGREPTTFEGSPQSITEGQQRIETVLAALQTADKEVVNTHADVLASTPLGPERKADMSGAAYAYTLALPNIYFHFVTAYGICRKEGVALGKRDYFVGFFPDIAGGR